MSFLGALWHRLVRGLAPRREVRPYDRDLHEVNIGPRKYCVYTEQLTGTIAYRIQRSTIREVTGGTCAGPGVAVSAEVAADILAKLEAHFRRAGVTYMYF